MMIGNAEPGGAWANEIGMGTIAIESHGNLVISLRPNDRRHAQIRASSPCDDFVRLAAWDTVGYDAMYG